MENKIRYRDMNRDQLREYWRNWARKHRGHKPKAISDLKERFWKRVRKSQGCWIWTGSISGNGYGKIWVYERKGTECAHRVAYKLTFGSIPEGMHIDHLCRNTKCVNPDHLEVVTPKENLRRGISPTAINARKKLCKRGHQLIPVVKGTGRYCRECKKMRERKEWLTRTHPL